MNRSKEGEGALDRSREVNVSLALLASDWNDSDENESEDDHVLPETISTDPIVDLNSNKTSFTPKSVAVDEIKLQTNNVDNEQLSLCGVSSPVFKRTKVVPSSISAASQQNSPGGDGTNIVSDKCIDTAQNNDDLRTQSKKRKGDESPHMVPPVKRSPRIISEKLSLDKSLEGIFKGQSNPLQFASSIQQLEVVFDCLETIPSVQKAEVRDILERRRNKVDMGVVLRQFEYKTAKSIELIRDHGLVHKGGSIDQVSWTILGKKDEELKGDAESISDDMFPVEVGLGTRASARIRNSRRLSSKNETPKAMPVQDDVYEFHDNQVEYQVIKYHMSDYQANDDDDFVDQDIKEDPNYEVKTEKSLKGRGKGKGKGEKGGKVGGGRGRGRPRGSKTTEVDDNTKIEEFHSPGKGKDMEEGNILVEEGTMSPLTASCNRPGLSGLGYSQEYFPLGSRISPRSKSSIGICPMCDHEFDMVLLERHAYSCQGRV